MDSKGGGNPATCTVERRQSSNSRVFRQHVGSVSDAWWPAHMRRSLETGRIAQGRRLLLISCRRARWLGPFATIFQFGTRLLLIVTSTAIGGTIVAALLLRTWYILMLPVLLLPLLTAVVIKLARALHLPWRRPLDLVSSISPPRNQALFPDAYAEPVTPLPATPLIRVLETYDLSASDVQHFVAPFCERDTAELRLNLEAGPTCEDDEENGETVTGTQLL
jgi:hypothetical protein